MKVAITSSGNTLDSKLDSRFGRCAYLAVYDLDNHTTEFISNPNKDKIEGAGPATVQLIASLNVQKVVSGEFGDKVKAIFDSLQIQLIILKDPGKKVSEIIYLLNR
jgi:predicted Fe-Mo cluster-binding NifX family protein